MKGGREKKELLVLGISAQTVMSTVSGPQKKWGTASSYLVFNGRMGSPECSPLLGSFISDPFHLHLANFLWFLLAFIQVIFSDHGVVVQAPNPASRMLKQMLIAC